MPDQPATTKTDGYLALPDRAGRRPGVVIIHDVLGFTPDSRRQADWLADEGFIAQAVDLYQRGSRLLCIRAAFRDLTARRGRSFDIIDSARRNLASRGDCTGDVGVIGFCLGGGFALLCAQGHGFGAAAVNYGPVPKDADELLRGACPIIANYGASDIYLGRASRRLDRSLTAAGVPHETISHPGAGHAFMNQHGGATGWIMAHIGMAHDPAAEANARKHIVQFFNRHLSEGDKE